MEGISEKKPVATEWKFHPPINKQEKRKKERAKRKNKHTDSHR